MSRCSSSKLAQSAMRRIVAPLSFTCASAGTKVAAARSSLPFGGGPEGSATFSSGETAQRALGAVLDQPAQAADPV